MRRAAPWLIGLHVQSPSARLLNPNPKAVVGKKLSTRVCCVPTSRGPVNVQTLAKGVLT